MRPSPTPASKRPGLSPVPVYSVITQARGCDCNQQPNNARGKVHLLSAQASRFGSLHPKANASSGSVHAQKDPGGTEESLATSKYGLPPALHLPSLLQSRKAGVTEQWDRKQGEVTWVSSCSSGLGSQGDRTLYSRWSVGPRKERGQGLGLGWASVQSLLA